MASACIVAGEAVISQPGIDLIKKHEKCRLVWYLPTPADKPTVGWGHCDPSGIVGATITQEQADDLLVRDLAHFDECVADECPEATDDQHAAMCCLAFNIGCNAFRKSSVARLHNAGEYGQAAQAFALWNKQAGAVLVELVHRRAEEAALYAAGSVPINAVAVGSRAEGEKPLAVSRTIIATATAGLGTAGSVVSQVRQQADGIHDAVTDGFHIWQMMGHNLGWIALALVAVGLGGIVFAKWSERHTGRS